MGEGFAQIEMQSGLVRLYMEHNPDDDLKDHEDGTTFGDRVSAWLEADENAEIVIGYDFDSGLALVKPSLPLRGVAMPIGSAEALAMLARRDTGQPPADLFGRLRSGARAVKLSTCSLARCQPTAMASWPYPLNHFESRPCRISRSIFSSITRGTSSARYNAFRVCSSPTSRKTRCRSAGIGCLECKQPVIEAINAELAPMRTRAQTYLDDPTLARNIIADGCDKAKRLAAETMREVRAAMGLDYQ
mgnify:CR=1 FL=1